jgi:hypothetical protein
MNRRASVPWGWLALVAHLCVGCAALGWLWNVLERRQVDVDRIATQAAAERAETTAKARTLAADEARREGLRAQDPFVIELLARERLGWQRPGDVTLAPAVDKPASNP